MSFFSREKRVYLDYAAATPLSKEVQKAMASYEGEKFANASAIYAEGRKVRDAIENAREDVARTLRIRTQEAFFVSGGTEANNLMLFGLIDALIKTGRQYSECEIITTALEHPSILGVLRQLEKRGVVVHTVPVDSDGLILHDVFEKLLSPKTVLVTCAYANSEIGVVQDIKRIARAIKKYKGTRTHSFPYFHVDASQAPLYLTCTFDSLGVDCMTLDSGKFGGPKGCGVLAKKQYVPLSSILYGGDQEEGMRPGTENTAAIVGFARAFSLAQEGWELRAKKVALLRDYAREEILKEIPGIIFNGSIESRIANNINISIPGIDGEYAAVVLDHNGFAVSTKSACSGASGTGSHVIYAMGGDDARALSTLRITLGEATTKRNIDDLVRVVKRHTKKMRELLDQVVKK